MRKFLTIFIMFILTLSVYGQSDEILDILYDQENAQTIYTSLLVLQAAGIIDADGTIDDAKSFLEGTTWGSTVLMDEEYISAGGFSLLVMESFKLPHGLVYNFLPIKRYALKELVFQKYILGNPYPNDTMSSFDVVYAISSLPVPENINKNYIDKEEVLIQESVIEESVIEEVSSVEIVDEVEIESDTVDEVDTEVLSVEEQGVIEDQADTEPVLETTTAE